MYRIRAASGSEAVYNSLEEFHAAVRRGEVAAEDEIFHTRANRWLDVKSHPHYRSAVGWNGSAEAAHAPAPVAPAPAPAPRAAATPTAHAAEARAHGAEPVRPAAAQQTVLRPQLVADRPAAAPAPAPTAAAPTPPPAAPGPPRKSRELAFIDLGEPAPPKPQNVTIVEAQKPAPKAPPQQPQRGTEIQFLVMDGGIESPVRNSAGHRTVAEDLDLLFDAPLPAAGNVAVAPPPAPPAPPKVETTVRPAASTPVAEPPRPEEPKPAPAPAASPRPSAPRLEVVKPAPKPEPSASPVQGAEPKVEAPASVAPKPEPARPSAPRLEALKTSAPRLETIKPAAPVAPAPVPVPAAPSPAATHDLDIPDASLLTEPAVAHPAPAAAGGARARTGMLYGAGAFVLVLGVAVAAWKPWARGEAASPAAAPVTRPASSAPAESAITNPTGGVTALTSAAKPAGRGPDGAAPKPDSAVEAPKDEIIAAARPNFRPDVDVGAASLSIGGDLPGAQPSVTSVAPSEFARRLVHAESQLQEDLAGRLGGFRDLLTAERLRTADGAARARTAWGAGADAIRQYRARLARLEQAYEDSAMTSQRAQRWPAEELRAWSARQTVAEPAEVAQLADLMVAQVSEGLDLLAASDGQYTIKGDRIAFTSAGAVPRYLSIRTWVDQRMGAWQAQPENARPHTVSLLLRALGEGFPAVQ